jgi:hypothetical protein
MSGAIGSFTDSTREINVMTSSDTVYTISCDYILDMRCGHSSFYCETLPDEMLAVVDSITNYFVTFSIHKLQLPQSSVEESLTCCGVFVNLGLSMTIMVYLHDHTTSSHYPKQLRSHLLDFISHFIPLYASSIFDKNVLAYHEGAEICRLYKANVLDLGGFPSYPACQAERNPT